MLTAVARRINSQGRNLRCIAQRSSSSFLEPNPTLVGGGGRAEVAEADESGYGRDSQLRKDVRTMGSVLGQVILAHEGEDVVNKVEKLRALAKVWMVLHENELAQTQRVSLNTPCHHSFVLALAPSGRRSRR